MARRRIVMSKGTRGANIAGEPFKVSALITTGVAVSGKLALGTIYMLTDVADCSTLGLDNAYDTSNNVAVYEHISEFFRMAKKAVKQGEAPKLYLMVVAQTVTMAQMCDDTGLIYAKKLINEGKGEIHNLSIGFNPASGYTETLTDGINADVRASIVKAQALYDWAYENDMPTNIYLECRGYGGNQTTAIDLRAIPASPSGIFEADKVSLVIGQDYGFADTLTGLAQKHAAIGTFLGTMAACDLNQNPSEVEAFNLTDEKKGKWLTAGLSDHTKVSDVAVAATLDTLEEKAYIFADTVNGVSGYRWSDEPTCTPVLIDDENNMNEHTIPYGRTMDYAEELLRKALINLVKKVKPVDPVTGKMPAGVIKDIEKKGDNVFVNMAANGWISGGKTYVDPNSDIIINKSVDISFSIIPTGSIGTINGTVNLKIKL